MKNLSFSFLLVLIFSAFVVSYNVIAQPPQPPCSYPCEDIPWQHVVVPDHILPGGLCPTCNVSFEYWCRDCNGQIQVIVGTVYISGDCALCESWITWYAHDWASKNNLLIMQKFNENWIPGQTYCYDEVKFSMLACYHFVPGGGLTNPEGFHSEPCLSTECCFFDMTICKNANGQIESAWQHTWPPIEIVCEGGCIQNCVFFSDANKIGSIADNNSQANNNVMITPNPNNGKFIVNFNVAEKGVYTVIITDLLGNTVYSESISVNSLSMQKEITIDRCNTGTYLYSIIFDTQSYQSGKISVVK